MVAVATLPKQVVATYLRVSTGEQNEENQEPEVRALLAQRFPSAEVVFYKERASATKGKRPVFETMMADARAGRLSAIVVWKLDRFGRNMVGNLRDVLALDESGVGLVSVRDSFLDTQGPMRKLLIAIFSWFAEEEARNTSLRTKTTLTNIRSKGGVTNQQPFGLRIERSADDVPRAALDPALRPALQEMAEMLCSGIPRRSIARRLNAKRVGGRNTWDGKRVKATVTDARLREAGAWTPEMVERIDAALAGSKHAAPRGAAAPAHLASSFIACGICGGAVTARRGGAAHYYVCAKCQKGGSEACVGIGLRRESEVDRTLVEMVRGALTGSVKARALEIAREMLDAAPDIASEREAIAAALAEAEAAGSRLAVVAGRAGGDVEALASALKANDEEKRKLRARLARLDAAPPSLDKRRQLATIEERLGELSKALDQGGIAARPAVEAVLQGARLTAIPVVVDGVRRWGLHGWLPSGYLLGLVANDGAQGSGRAPPRESAVKRVRERSPKRGLRITRPRQALRAERAPMAPVESPTRDVLFPALP